MRVLRLVVSLALLGSVGGAFADGSCDYQGVGYLNGSDVCQMGARFRCENSAWRALNVPCALQSRLSQGSCDSEGQSYPSGRVRCTSKTQERCDDGTWQPMGTTCDGNAVTAPNGFVAIAVSQRSCQFAGALFQEQSMMCRNGTTFICQGGTWNDAQLPCS